MSASEVKLQFSITEGDADAERLDELTQHWMRDLNDLGAESVERSGEEEAPPGAKGDPFTWGALALAVVPTLLPKLVELGQTWVSEGTDRTIRIKTPAGAEIEFTPDKPLSKDDMADLVQKLSGS